MKIGAIRRSADDAFGLACAFHQALTQGIDLAKISAHPFQHDLMINVDHVPVTNPVMVHDRGHFGTRRELTRLRLRGKNRNL